MRLETPFRSVRNAPSTSVEVTMWNHFISSPYAHLVTAIAVTFGLALVLLTAHPQKAGFVEADNSARGAPSRASAPATLASDRIRLIRDNGTTGKSP